MTNSAYVRRSLARAVLENLPPLVRNSLLEQREFCEEYDFRADADISFDNSEVKIRRSALFDAIRSVLADQRTSVVTDTNDRHWEVVAESEEGDLPQIHISNNGQWHLIPGVAVFSPDSAIRLRWLKASAASVNLPTDATTTWHEILSERRLRDDELDPFLGEFRDTPVEVARSIRAGVQCGQLDSGALAPGVDSRRYFSRLVGEYENGAGIADYAEGAGRKFIETLFAWRPYDGFLSSLFLSSHSALTAEISVGRLDDQDLVRAFKFLVEQGDRLSQLGAVEVGLRVLPERPEIESSLVQIVQQIRDDDVDDPGSAFGLLSALFVGVDGKLSSTRRFSDSPPFYRRLASLAQASLIQREVLDSPIEVHLVSNWISDAHGRQFHAQSLVDMRREPRWSSGFVGASQLKAYFFRRLTKAGEAHEGNLCEGELRNILIGSDSGSLLSLIQSPRPYFAGPLEGEERSAELLPERWVDAVNEELKREEVGPSSFVSLVHFSRIFRPDESQSKLAAEALNRGKHRLGKIEEGSQIFAILHGLATVAAVARGKALADELRVLVRRYRRDAQYTLAVDDAMEICVVAAASRGDLDEWSEWVGDWLTELAFEDIQPAEAAMLYDYIERLCHAAPELWVSCGRAHAAVAALMALR